MKVTYKHTNNYLNNNNNELWRGFTRGFYSWSKQRNKSASRKKDRTSKSITHPTMELVGFYFIWYAFGISRYICHDTLSEDSCESDGGVHVWRSSSILLRRVFFSFAGYRKDLVSLLWIPAYVMESYPCSAPPIQSRVLARNLSSLTRWRSCLYELVLRAVDGGGFLVRCRSISFATSPLAKSCF